jgi:predicted Zn-ribbon and HTH transcriptional regulator
MKEKKRPKRSKGNGDQESRKNKKIMENIKRASKTERREGRTLYVVPTLS